jgi:hypothetical protein
MPQSFKCDTGLLYLGINVFRTMTFLELIEGFIYLLRYCSLVVKRRAGWRGKYGGTFSVSIVE